jgi:DNA-binding GntR family transcriptional regulator
MFGVSVGPVREAIRRLTGEGLLEFTPHRGASVRMFNERDVRETFQVREALEGYVARLAAQNVHRGDYAARLVACQQRLHETANAAADELSDVRQTFHDLLYEIAGNAMLQEAALRVTFPVFRLQFNRLTGTARARQSLLEHDEIIAAILSGDGVRAERAMQSHLRNGATAVCEALDDLRANERAPRKANAS